MSPRLIRNATILLALLVVGGIALGWWYMAIGRFPLRGDTRHDFGIIALYGGPGSKQHTFHLENVTGRTVEILDIKPSCGCTVADTPKTHIEPGETVDIVATLTLNQPGPKKTDIQIVLSDGIQTLWVQGEGRTMISYRAEPSIVRMRKDEPKTVTINATLRDRTEAPPRPLIKAPVGVAVTSGKWEQETTDAPPDGSRWRLVLTATATVDHIPFGSQLSVKIGDTPPVMVLLSDEPPGSADASP